MLEEKSEVPDQNPKSEASRVIPSATAPPDPEKEAAKDMSRDAVTPSTNPSWFTPGRLLAIFCVINLINYVDRGAIASNGVNGSRRTCSESGTCSSGTGIQGQFNLNNFEDGVISSAFMVGLLVASPIFASSAKCVNPFRLIGVGLTVWTLAVAFCGFSFNFWSIAIARMFVGVGEASFISLAPPFIDDNAPPSKRTAWLGTFYMCIPTGVAVGYVYGGLIGHHGWRWAFWIEALLMVPFAIFGFWMKPLYMKGFLPVESGAQKSLITSGDVPESEGGGSTGSEISTLEVSRCSVSSATTTFLGDMKELFLEKVFVVNVLGYIAYNFVIGAYSYWGPKAGYNIYNMKNADYVFGGVTAICGILGSLAGGFVLDLISSTLPNAFKLLSISTLVGAAFCFGAFCMKGLYGFLALFAIGELLVFATQAPVNFVCLHCVKPSLRPLSMAISTVLIHVLGDVPSSPLVGLLQDRINNWRKTALILTSILFVAAIVWFLGVFLKSVDRYNEDSEKADVSVVEKSSSTPLLKENGVDTA